MSIFEAEVVLGGGEEETAAGAPSDAFVNSIDDAWWNIIFHGGEIFIAWMGGENNNSSLTQFTARGLAVKKCAGFILTSSTVVPRN